MSYITVGQENSGPIDIYYEDHGSGRPVVLVHGWPLSSASWEKQVPVLLDAGFRVVTYDRRGFGKSSQPSTGHDYDTMTEDLHKLITKLDLRDVTLVGFSMGGGEVARYFGRYGSDRVSKAVFIDAVPPYLKKTADNPEGLDPNIVDGLMKGLAADRPAFLSQFLADFYNTDVLMGKRVSQQVVDYSWNIAVAASPIGTVGCAESFLSTDFRGDLARIDVPTLVIHGDADRVCPIDITGMRTHNLVNGSRMVIIEDGPHGTNWTHAEILNPALLDFIRQPAQALAA